MDGYTIGGASIHHDQVGIGEADVSRSTGGETRRPSPQRGDLHRKLLEISQRILAGEEIQEILDQVISAITHHTSFQRGVLTLYDRPITPRSIEQVRINRVACSGVTAEEEAQLKAHPLPPRERKKIFQEEFRVSRSYYIPHDRNPWGGQPGIVEGKSEPNAEGPWHPEDFLFIPMWMQGQQLMGLISVDEPRDGRAPTRTTLEPIEIFANLAALAIEKSQHIEALTGFQRRLQGIYRLSRRLARFDVLDTMLDQAMEMIIQNFDYDYVIILLAEGDELVHKAHKGRIESPFRKGGRVKFGEGVTGWVAAHRHPALVEDVTQDSRYIAGNVPMGSELAVPIQLGGELYGVLNLENREMGAFTDEDLQLLTALADQLAVALSNVRSREQLTQFQQRLQGIYQLSEHLAKLEDLDTLLEQVMKILIDNFDYDYAVLLLKEGDHLIPRGFDTRLPEEEILFDNFRSIPLGRGVTGWVAHHCKPELVRDTRRDQRFIAGHPNICSELAVPIVEEDEVLGVLNIESVQEDAFSEDDLELMIALARQLGVAIASLRRRQRLQQQATHDSLTQVYNRHYFNELIREEETRALRYLVPISLVLIDFDDFHKVNEKYGHLEGDRVLREAAHLFQKSVREVDAVIRYGGDEFLIVMPETREVEADRAAERIANLIAATDFGISEKMSISTGVAAWEPNRSQSFEAILEQADRWVFHRKEAGKGTSGSP